MFKSKVRSYLVDGLDEERAQAMAASLRGLSEVEGVDVSVTRAMEALYLCSPMLNQQGNQVMRLNPSRFIQEVDPSRYETLRVAPRRSY